MPQSLRTGHAGLDFALEAGPRVLTPDTPEDILIEIGKYDSLAWYREEMRRRKLARIAKIKAIVARQGAANRLLERLYAGRPWMLPSAKIPVDLVHELEAENKEQWNAAMREDTLRHYPELRINVPSSLIVTGWHEDH